VLPGQPRIAWSRTIRSSEGIGGTHPMPPNIKSQMTYRVGNSRDCSLHSAPRDLAIRSLHLAGVRFSPFYQNDSMKPPQALPGPLAREPASSSRVSPSSPGTSTQPSSGFAGPLPSGPQWRRTHRGEDTQKHSMVLI
jgi:hypothetical protein